MSAFTQRAASWIRWIWSHIAAAVGLALIVAALMIGYSIGRPASVSSDEALDQNTEEVADADSAPQMYTCSMHPTVRLEDPNAKCPICFMELIPVMDNAGGEGMEMRMVLSEASRAMSRIETTKVGRFYPSAETRLYGKIVYDETSVARLSAYFPGRINRLFVNYVGVTVKEGDHLAELYSPELLSVFEELRQAKKSFDSAGDGSQFLRETSSQTLIASREKLRLFGLTQQQVDDVESGSFDSDELTIYSPIGGVVTHLAAREGDYLKTGDPIATVSDLSRLWLDLEAYESQLAMLRWGLPVAFTVEAHPGEVFEGRVAFIEPIVDERTRTVAVRVAVDN
ncbi:MAG: efflux RND transporter periplasmic adaptor subunit, partial [Phycisphaerales bacterium]|nr:efflux RND transporter periplasmic adaptor subunit [Phycisphaerales bacterium]